MPGQTHSGHRLVSRVGSVVDPERMAVIVRNMRIIGACLGIAVIAGSLILAEMNGGFEWTAYHSSSFRSSGGEGLSNEATGLLFGAIFMLGPLATGWAFRQGAGEVLYLDGTRLTVVRPGRRAPEVFDLARARSEVRLDKVPGSRPGSAEARQQVGSYRPVLVLRNESGREAVIELANQRSRAMRLSHETRMLADAMRFTADPKVQHTAGQLRTVLRWTKLPVIHDAAPDAIPASPEDAASGPIPRTPVIEGVEGPELEITGPRRG